MKTSRETERSLRRSKAGRRVAVPALALVLLLAPGTAGSAARKHAPPTMVISQGGSAPDNQTTQTPASGGAAQPSANGASNGGNTVAPGVEFTRVQDLNPEKRATNRPIKQKWAVVVGISEFKEARMNESPAMEHAAKEFYDYLVDPNGGRFAPDHVRFLSNNSATLRNITASLGQQWLGSLAGPDDLVVVFFSTSSFPTTDGSTYLCAHDVALDNVAGTCVSMQYLMDSLKHDVKTDRVLLVLQACYSGSAELSGSKSLCPNYNVDVTKVPLGKGYVILSSSTADQRTFGDLFTRNLVAALRKENGLVPLATAFESARKATEDGAGLISKGARQTPIMKSQWQGNDLIVGIPPVEQVTNLPSDVKNFLSAESYYLKATKLIQGGDVDGAIVQYKQALGIDPIYADALGDLAAALWIKGDVSAAADMLKRAVAAAPRDSLFHLNYARVLDKQGDSAGSEHELALAYSLNPKDTTVLIAVARKAMDHKNYDRAVSLLKSATLLAPTNADIRIRLSYALAQTGKSEEAVTQAREAVKLNPQSVTALINLGSSLLLQGQPVDAISTYKQAITLDSKNADAHYLLSNAMQRQGDKAGAKAEIQLFIELTAPGDPRVESAKARLSQLTQ
jgi:Flp pilus assembly protein TadD